MFFVAGPQKGQGLNGTGRLFCMDNVMLIHTGGSKSNCTIRIFRMSYTALVRVKRI